MDQTSEYTRDPVTGALCLNKVEQVKLRKLEKAQAFKNKSTEDRLARIEQNQQTIIALLQQLLNAQHL